MRFSFRALFQAHPDNAQDAELSMPGNLQPAHSKPAQNPSTAMTACAPPLNSVSPFRVPLFKFAQGEEVNTASLQPSPFAESRSASTSAPLTVADLLPLLPLEISRTGRLPMEQPVAISPQVLNEALRDGQAALPIFEIYRVCPALFQTPISPQDPRMIPLPASKLPYLIAATTQASTMTEQPAISASPFAMPAPSQEAPALTTTVATSGMILPPRRQGPPPPLADVPNREAAAHQLSLPGQAAQGAPAFPMSPFAAVGSQMNEITYESQALPLTTSSFGQSQQPTPAASPFGQAITPAVAHSHGQKPETGLAPSSYAQMPKAASAQSPFGQAPASANPMQSPLGSLFGANAVPTGEPAPDIAPARLAQPHGRPVASASSASGHLVRICLANLLKGYTSAELGFDPIVVPGWITTALPSVMIQQLASSQMPVAELGLFIDGITDIGFRNVLNTAKRDFQLRILAEDLQSAMAGVSAPQVVPNLTSLGAAPQFQVNAPALSQTMMQAEPLNATLFPQIPPLPTALTDLSIPGTNSPFLAPPAQQADASPSVQPSPFIPSFGTAITKPAIQASGFGMPAAALQPLSPKTIDPFDESTPAQTKPFFTLRPHQSAPPATFQPQQASSESQNLEASATVKASEQEPRISFFQAPSPHSNQPEVFKAPQALFTQPEEQTQPTSPQPAASFPTTKTTVTPPERQKESSSAHPGFALMNSSNPMEEGLTSDQLLGRNPSLEQGWSAATIAASSSPMEQFAASEAPEYQSPAIDLPQVASSSAPITPRAEEPEIILASGAQTTSRAPAVRLTPSLKNNAPNSNLGVQMHDTDPNQILLRALLDTDTDLTPQKVVEMTCNLPGIAACVCIQGTHSISHIGTHKPQAREFQKQATELAQHLRTLAPLIGIEGAETFTMNSGDRLMTFCFPEGSILGVLHDAEPALGLRDKITLIARELSRMVV